MVDRKIFWTLLCTLISNSGYALIAPFLPSEFRTQGISGEMIGLMFAIYSVPVILFSPLIGKTVECVGRANMIALGIAAMGFAFVCFGFVPWLEQKGLVLFFGFSLRFLQGTSSAFVQTTCYAIVTNDFPDRKEQIVGWVEALQGLGLVVGPIIGSALYTFLGYEKTFFCYGGLLLVLSLIIKMNFPENMRSEQSCSGEHHTLMDEPNSLTEVLIPMETSTSEVENSQRVSMCKLLCSARFTAAAFASALSYFTYSFTEPILAERLEDFDMTKMQVGLFFSILPVCYMLASLGVHYIPKQVEKRVTIILSTVITGVALLFVGPSVIFGFKDSLLLMGIGQALVGIFMTTMIIPSLPEMVESALPCYPGQERDVNNLSSGIYNSFLGFGQVTSPFYGAAMAEVFGFRFTVDTVALIYFFFLPLYVFLAGGVEAFRLTFSCKRSEADFDNEIAELHSYEVPGPKMKDKPLK